MSTLNPYAEDATGDLLCGFLRNKLTAAFTKYLKKKWADFRATYQLFIDLKKGEVILQYSEFRFAVYYSDWSDTIRRFIAIPLKFCFRMCN